jgi:hypothetical protein
MELLDIYLKILLHFQELEKENKSEYEFYGIFRIHQEKDSFKNEILESLSNDTILLKTNIEYFLYIDVFIHIFVDVYQIWIQKQDEIQSNEKMKISYCVNHAFKWIEKYEEYSHRYFVKEVKKICEKYKIKSCDDMNNFLEKASMKEIICFFVDCEEDDPFRKRYLKEKSTIIDIQNVIDMICEIQLFYR